MNSKKNLFFTMLISAAVLGTLVPQAAQAAQTKPATVSVEQTPEYQEAKAQLEQISSSYQSLAQENSKTLDEIDDARAKIRKTQEQIGKAEDALSESQDELNEKQKVLARRMVSAYKRGPSSLMDLVLGVDSFDEFVSVVYYLDKIAQADAAAVADVNAARANLENKKQQLEDKQEALKTREKDLLDLGKTQTAQLDDMDDQMVQLANLLQGLSEEARTKMEEETGTSLDAPELVDALEEEEKKQETPQSEDKSEDEKQQKDEDKKQEETPKTTEKQESEKKPEEEKQQEEKHQETEKKEETEKKQEASDDAQQPKTEDKKQEQAPTDNKQQVDKNDRPAVSDTGSGNPPAMSASSLDGAPGSQAALISACYSTPTTGLHQCSLWVRNVFLNAGQPDYGNTAPYKWYNAYCFSSDRSELQPGMIVCTSTLPFGTGNGHVGIYVGNNTVMHNTSHWVGGEVHGSWVMSENLDHWIGRYGVAATPRWGWLGGVVLS